ncbi:MAG TPA: argininosuccinate lyase [Anaerolineae bacterium]|nr:argininosuccinate lyase [Anaerolineae bacterium]
MTATGNAETESRLTEPPAPELIASAYTREVGDAAILYEGMSLADMAHVVALIESDIIPRQAGGELLSALLDIHPSPPLDFALDPARGDLYSNREVYLRMLTSAAGWLSAGRARREATTIGYRIALRRRLLAWAAALEDGAVAALDQAEAHRATLFPDYTYLQPAQPTTFGHYLLTFVYPMLRDLDRTRAAFARANVSPAGSGSVNGSRLPLDRARLANLLGFDAVIPHTRDAMWQADGPIEIAALVAAALVNLDRLAEDLQIFSTAEFSLVQLADRHTRTSVIMPQKKNPYSLAYVRGVCGETIGALAAMAAVGKTPSGQIDNRIFAYGDVPRTLDSAIGAAHLTAGVLRGLRVNAEHAARRVAQDFIGATDLAEVIMLKTGLDYKTAHDVVGRAVRATMESGAATLTADSLNAAAGHDLGLTPEEIAGALDPARIVAARTGLGGAAESSVTHMIAECRQSLADHRQWREETQARLAEAESLLLMTAAALKTAYTRQSDEPVPEEPKPGPQSLEDLFDDLPQPPNRRRWRPPPDTSNW